MVKRVRSQSLFKQGRFRRNRRVRLFRRLKKSQSLFKQGRFRPEKPPSVKDKARQGRNPFLSRAGFDTFGADPEFELLYSRNPFLSRAGFDCLLVFMDDVENWSQSLFKQGRFRRKIRKGVRVWRNWCRNPFLSRAGFDAEIQGGGGEMIKEVSQSLFKQGRFRRNGMGGGKAGG